MDSNNPFDSLPAAQSSPTQGGAPQENSSSQSSNPFDSLPAAPTAQNAYSAVGGQDSAFMAGVDNFNRMFGRVAESTLQLGAQIGSKLGGGQPMTDYANQVVNSNQNLDALAAGAAQVHPIAAGVGTGLGIAAQAVPLVASGGAAAPSLGGGVLKNAGIGGAYGFLSQPGTLEDRMNNATMGALVGGAIPIAAKGLGTAIGDVANRVGGDSQYTGILPKIFNSEAAAAKDVTAINLPKVDLQKTLNDLVPGGAESVSKVQAAGYDSLKSIQVPQDLSQTLLTNPSITSRLDAINSSVDSSLKDLPDNNLAKMDGVKKLIDHEIWNSTKTIKDPGMKSLEPGEISSLMNTRNQIVDTLDKAGASQGIDYKALRQMGEKKILYENITDALNKTPDMKGAAPMFDSTQSVQNKSIDQLFKTLAGTPAKQDYFMNSLKSAGADVGNAKTLLTRLSDLRNNPIDKLVNKVGGNTLSDSAKATSWEDVVKDMWVHMSQGKYNEDVVKLMLSGPKMQSELSHVLSQPTVGFMVGLKSLFGKVGTSTKAIFNNPVAIKASQAGPGLLGGVSAPILKSAGYLGQGASPQH